MNNNLFPDSLQSLVALLLLTLLIIQACSEQEGKENKAIPVIFDTDIGPDYDDVGAITILHALEKRGEVEILATIASNRYERIASILDIFNTFYGNPDLPIGVPHGDAVSLGDSRHWTDSLLLHYPHSVLSNKEVPGAVRLYRKILSQEEDSSVTIISVGFLTNLADLLASEPDEYSPLNGIQLVEKKVERLVSMAGKFPSGKEFNIYKDVESALHVFHNWPSPVIFCGFEIGVQINTGLPLVQNPAITHNPTKEAYRISLPQSPMDSLGRKSWDQATVLAVVKGYRPYFSLHEGRIVIDSSGYNTWNSNGEGQYYLKLETAPEKIEDIINSLMMAQAIDSR